MKNTEQLLDKYNAGLASAEEIAIVERWYMDAGDTTLLPDNESILPDAQQILEDQAESRKKLIRYMEPKPKFRLWPLISSAAAIIIIAGVAFFYFSRPERNTLHITLKLEREITPGGNKATLTLANGKTITLTDANTGTVAEQAGIKITKTSNGQLIYQVANNKQTTSAVHPGTYNSIATPIGGQYQIVLPDGTKVWLNALSSIRYSVSMGTDKKRTIALKGEGYFEVSPDAARPFLVKTDKQNIEVLGTHFNISNYNDDETVTTTLLEGSVKAYNDKYSRIIKPGQQAQFESNGQINVELVNTEQAVAWKNGVFSFKKANLESVMRQIARWYNVEVTYEGKIPEFFFTGKIYRNLNLHEALKSIGYIGVNYKIENRRIIIKEQ